MISVRTHKVASLAWERVSARLELDNLHRHEYGALAHKLPGMILQNGLAQATGFLCARNDAAHRALLDDLNAVLRSAGAVSTDNGRELHEYIIGRGVTETAELTRRSLEAGSWIKRYVQGVLRVSATGDRDVADGAGRQGEGP